ncbi:TlpA family protein disulfide reductase [Anaeromicropila herbilytica]|uniref:Thioredoxin domain-containing protein n=1 Tax=Anaeromicropila herbilytica TaxID=2785025 RepID=A0A7R7ICI1_9FIRM|nr:TlpA disulfide reductase family protein [Anaeromicropila herbilytica]BCN29944.1 hypothetical protein bsdtb5_12390 [Anaeromicropila herbilytica]
MNEERLKKIEKMLHKIFILIGVILLISIVLLIREKVEIKDRSTSQNNQVEDKTKVKNREEGLSDQTLLLPERCNVYEQVPDFSFVDTNGKEHSIKDYRGKTVIVTFWASWCSDCQQQMPLVNQFLEELKKYDNVEMILVNKLDHKKESKANAIKYLEKNNIDIDTYYDDGLKAYESLGVHNIPTTLFIDANGIVRAISPKQMTRVTIFDSYLQDAMTGSDVVTSNFITNSMMDEDGGIHNVYDKDKSKTLTSDVLSESEGAMLEYATIKEDQSLFYKTLQFIRKNMWTEGMVSWKVSNKKVSSTNALIDDFRIYQAIIQANRLWGGYTSDIEKYNVAFEKYAINNNHYVDCYDFSSKTYSNRLTLCFADFKAMQSLNAASDKYKVAYENTLSIVKKGLISSEFPLYYSWYNYDNNSYQTNDLNMAEAMVTLLHLAREDLIQQKTIDWLKQQMNNGGIKARYSVDGKVVEGYQYESTAIYALVSMIADEIGDKDLRALALKKMEIMRIHDTALSYNGAFGLEDGTGITSFDQIMPMIAYAVADKNP